MNKIYEYEMNYKEQKYQIFIYNMNKKIGAENFQA